MMTPAGIHTQSCSSTMFRTIAAATTIARKITFCTIWETT
ncbi:Uncharacterised protein [Mycobacterium tuberculosis]|nr:Uncharacterised protein [Mycobacterium tuberculosis]